MTNLNTPQRSARPIHTADETHLFAIGQAVRLKSAVGQKQRSTGIYHVTATLPPREGLPQYRIRNDEERHERVTTQDNLEAVRPLAAGEGANLMERTFGRG